MNKLVSIVLAVIALAKVAQAQEWKERMTLQAESLQNTNPGVGRLLRADLEASAPLMRGRYRGREGDYVIFWSAARRDARFNGLSIDALIDQYGNLHVKSVPSGAQVVISGGRWLDGKTECKTDFEGLAFRGTYKIKIVKEGYQKDEKTVDVKIGETTSVEFTLKRVNSTSPH